MWRNQQTILRTLLNNDDALLLVHLGDSPLLHRLTNVTETTPSALLSTNIDMLPTRSYELRHWDWVITDNIVPTLMSVAFPGQGPTELDYFFTSCDNLGSNVIHFVEAPQKRERSLEQWSEFAPHHHWADTRVHRGN